MCTTPSWSPNSTVLHLDIYLLCKYTNLKDTAGQSAMCNPTNHHLNLLFIIIVIVVVVTFTGIAIALHNFPKTIVLAETKLLTNVHSQNFVIRWRFWLSFLFFWKIQVTSRTCKHHHHHRPQLHHHCLNFRMFQTKLLPKVQLSRTAEPLPG